MLALPDKALSYLFTVLHVNMYSDLVCMFHPPLLSSGVTA